MASLHLHWRLCGAFALSALTACNKPAPAPPAPHPVVSITVHPDAQAAASTYAGDIEASNSTPLSFRVSGKIIKRNARLGDTVKPGQVLARLDASDYDKNLAAAAAQLDAARHHLSFAQQQLDRDTAQAKANLIAAAQLEQTQNAYAQASAQNDQAQQQFALADNQRRYTQLVADHAGSITAETAATGQNVQAGQPVYQLAWSGATDVVVDLPENAVHAIRPGQQAQVSLPALPGKRYAAQVREIASAADSVSRTWRVKLALDRPDAVVRLGMSANVAFAASRANSSAQDTFTIPATALFHDGNAPAVWIIHPPDNTLALRRVTVSRYDAQTVTITAGLAANEQIVAQGVHTVTAGQQVRPVPPIHPLDGWAGNTAP